MFFFPIGLEDGFFRRMPWISILIAAVLLLVGLGTTFAPSSSTGGPSTEDLFAFYLQHPNVRPPKKLLAMVPGIGKALAKRKTVPGLPSMMGNGAPSLVSPAERAREQKKFDALAKAYVAAHKHNKEDRFGLTPAKGLGQLGTLTSPFVASNLWTLFWDLLLFYLVAPYLEDAFGRPVFAALFAGGALLSSALFVALAPHSHTAIFGPGGAIATLFGAFTVRFASRRVKMFWWFPLRKFGTFFIPAWMWAVVWLGSQVFWLGLGRYVGGSVGLVPLLTAFGLGALAAVVVKATDFEAKFVTPAIEGESFEQHAGVLEAFDALAKGDTAAATAAFNRALAEDPGNIDARLGLTRLAFETGDREAGTRRLDGLLTGCLSRQDLATAAIAVSELGHQIVVSALRPTTGYKAAAALETELPPEALEPLYRAGAQGAGALGAKAGLRAAEIDLDFLSRPADARALAEAVLQVPDLADDLKARAQGIVDGTAGVAAASPAPAAMTLELDVEGGPATPPAAAVPRRIIPVRFAGRVDDGYQVLLPNGQAQPLPRGRILGIAAGAVTHLDGDGGAAKNVVILDLVLARDATAVRSLRFTSRAMGLETLFDGTPPAQAFKSLVAELLATPGIEVRPARLASGLPRYEDLAAFEAEVYA